MDHSPTSLLTRCSFRGSRGATTALCFLTFAVTCLPVISVSVPLSAQQTELADPGAEAHALGLDYYSVENWDSAFHYTQLAVRLREAHFTEPSLALGKSNLNAGYVLRYRSRYRAARPYLERAVAVFSALDLPPVHSHRLPKAYLELARTEAGLGNYARAKACLRSAETLVRDVTATEMERPGTLLPDLLSEWAGILMEQDSLPAAIHAARRAEAAYDRLLAAGEDRHYERLTARSNLAAALNKAGRFDEARPLYAALEADYASYEDYENLALILNNLGDMLVRSGDPTSAGPVLKRAQRAAEASGDPTLLAQYYDHEAGRCFAEGRHAAALRMVQLAQRRLIRGYAPDAPTAVPSKFAVRSAQNPTDLFEYLLSQARFLGHQEPAHREAQYELYYAADALLDELRLLGGERANKLFWRRRAHPFYTSVVAAAHRDGRAREAWYFAEKARAVLLYEALANTDARQVLPDSLARADRQREDELSTLVTATDFDRRATLRHQASLDSFRTVLRQSYPEYRRLTAKVSVPPPEDFYAGHLAQNGQALIHFTFSDTALFVLVLAGPEPRLVTLPVDAVELKDDVTALTDYFGVATTLQDDPLGYARVAHRLYQRLLEPLGLPADRSLLIVPDGLLARVPFAALLTSEELERQLRNWPFLLRSHAVSYAYSAATLPPPGGAVRAGVITALAPFGRDGGLHGAPILDAANDETYSLAERYSVRALRDSAATLARFRALAPTAKYLHLSTHAYATADGTSEPRILFYDEALPLEELYALPLEAELVVLSACRSNVGTLARGEGVLGLGRGFSRAGAGGVVASLWNVNARGGSQLLNRYYDALADGHARSGAISAAQMAYLDDPNIPNDQKSPYYWAAWVYYGRDGTLVLDQESEWTWAAIGGLALVIILSLGWWIYRRGG